MSRWLRVANGIMLILFICWAGFQYNDPDGLLWMAVYGAAAVECILYYLGRLPRILAVAYAGFCVGWGLYLGIRVILETEFFFDEQGREMMGLFICALWTAVLITKPFSRDVPQAAEMDYASPSDGGGTAG